MTLNLFTVFHLNLAYSSIEVEQRPEVVERCYWPLLALMQKHHLQIGIEASGYTLEKIKEIDETWIQELRHLLSEGICEFIGSGYSQIIGPLVPAKITSVNLKLGNKTYERILGFRPRIALVNEQAYSAGLLQHYRNAGYDATIMEWENCNRAHPEWRSEWRYLPQYAVGHHGEKLPVLWSQSISFQKFQRYAHGDLELDQFLDYLRKQASSDSRALSLYCNDAEIFNFRPNRYQTEPLLSQKNEWQRIELLLLQILEEDAFDLVAPSQVLSMMEDSRAGNHLHLESSSQPIPVKKQGKYNITRWALTGRDDFGINSTCRQIYHALKEKDAPQEEWQEMCYLWSSDFRTHITEKRWRRYLKRLAAFESKVLNKQREGTDLVEAKPVAINDVPIVHQDALPQNICSSHVISRSSSDEKPSVVTKVNQIPPKCQGINNNSSYFSKVYSDGRFLAIETDTLNLKLNCRRGMAIEGLCFTDVSSKPLLCTLPHGYYDDIAMAADFYTGHLTFEILGQPKVTDLNPVKPEINNSDQWIDINGMIPIQCGAVEKTIRVFKTEPLVELSYRLKWSGETCGVLRLGHFTLNPEAFDRSSLFFSTHNGGYRKETFRLDGVDLDHGAPVSFLVSANQGIGMTEGEVILGDADRQLQIKVIDESSSPLGFLTYRNVGDSYFYRLNISLNEVDDTYRESESRIKSLSRPIRFSISPFKSET